MECCEYNLVSIAADIVYK